MGIQMLAGPYPLLLSLAFEFDRFLYFHKAGRACAVS